MAITRFAAVFEHHCGRNPARARGSVYWNSTLIPRARTSWTMSGEHDLLPGSAIQVAGVLEGHPGGTLAGQAVTNGSRSCTGERGPPPPGRTTGAGGVRELVVVDRPSGSVRLRVRRRCHARAEHRCPHGRRGAAHQHADRLGAHGFPVRGRDGDGHGQVQGHGRPGGGRGHPDRKAGRAGPSHDRSGWLVQRRHRDPDSGLLLAQRSTPTDPAECSRVRPRPRLQTGPSPQTW